MDKLTPHDYQEVAIQQILRDKSVLVKAPVGAGKSLTAVEAMLRAGTEVNLIVAPLNTFRGWAKTLERQSGGEHVLRFIDARKAGKEAHEALAMEEPGFYFMGTERFRTQDWKGWRLDALVADECFVEGTLIETPQGPRKIEDLAEGDEVYGYDHDSNRVIVTKVRARMERQANDVAPNGATVNHPYWVEGVGYLPLGDITGEDEVIAYEENIGNQDTPCVRLVRGDVLLEGVGGQALWSKLCPEERTLASRGQGTASEAEARVLESSGYEGGAITGDARAIAQSRIETAASCGGADDHGQPRFARGRDCARSGDQEVSGSSVRSFDWWERNGGHSRGSDAVRGSRVEYPGDRTYAHAARAGLPNTLQVGCSERVAEDWCGVRWGESQEQGSQGTGPQEGGLLEGAGLDPLAILEPRNRERFEQVRRRNRGRYQTVYNIETGSSNYFAGGFLVHNCHRFQSRKSANHRMLMTAQAEYKIMLSATPPGNKVEGFWALGRWLSPETFDRSFWRWGTEHLHEEPDPYTYKKFVGEKVPGTIWKSFKSAVQMPNVYTGVPAIHEVEVELNPTQRKHYKELEEDAITFLEENPLVTDLPSTKYIRMMEMTLATPSVEQVWDDEAGEFKDRTYFKDDAKSSKADAVLEILSDLFAEKPVPVLVFTHSRKFATFLTKRLQSKGIEARQFVGGMDPEERRWKLDNFGVEYDVLVATISTIGEGWDGGQEICHNEIWCSVSDNRILNTQAQGRLSRQGQKEVVNRFVLLAKDTIETSKQHPRLRYDEAILEASYSAIDSNR